MPFPAHSPFIDSLGLELHEFGNGGAQVQIMLSAQHMNSWGVGHGGVLMSLLDVTMAQAARSPHAGSTDTGPGVATIEMKTTFMRAAQGRLRAQGRVLQRTMTLVFCEGSVFDANGELCAHATATFKPMRALPAPDGVKQLQPPLARAADQEPVQGPAQEPLP